MSAMFAAGTALIGWATKLHPVIWIFATLLAGILVPEYWYQS
jgi:hypothetical protein